MKKFSLIAAPFIVATLLLAPLVAVAAENLDSASGERLAVIIRGGLLYDKWYGELGTPAPSATHSAYPKSAKYKGSSTWRCKECHGWDNRGRDGAYSKGSHHSGIKGIRAAAGGSESSVVAVLQDRNHGYGSVMAAADLRALAAFVVAGQIDMNRYIEGKKAKGNVFRGGRLYLSVCARCHGADGKAIDFGGKNKSVFMGTVANSNPWETLHKIRFGQPKEEMPAMLALAVQDQVDILAYAQSLPKK